MIAEEANMADIPNRVERILNTDCGQSLEELASQASAADIKQLIEVVSDPKETTTRITRAVFLLGRMKQKQALEAILAAAPRLKGDDQIAVADALGRLGGAKARGELIKLSSEESPQVRKFSARALARIGDKTALARLRKIAKEDKEDFVRQAAEKQLNKLSQ
jgi:HEAT repeat protein